MIKLAKLSTLAAVSAACAALFGTTSANAYVYGVSHLKVQDLTIAVTPAATATSFTFNQVNTASMNGGPTATGASCNSVGAPACGAGPVLDSGPANAAGSTLPRVNNSFAFLGTNQVDSYSGADSVITTAQLVTGTPTNVEQIAESLLNTNGFATASSEQQSNTALSFVFDVAGGSTLSLRFLADPDQRSGISGLIGGYLSQTNLNASFTLSGNGGSVSWAPQGTADNDCNVLGLAGVTCTETDDDADLNFNTSTAVNPSNHDNSFEVGDIFAAFGIDITGLAAGSYTLALNAVTSTSIIRNVPEPDALALLGIALAGLALTTRRRKQA